MREAPAAVELRDVSKSFPGVQALSGVTLRVERGEILGLIGENGAGKSTLVKLLAGIHAPDSGEILVEGRQATIHDPADARSRGLAFILQDRNLAPHLSVQENIFAGRQPRRVWPFIQWGELARECRALLAALPGGLDPAAMVRRLSPAQQQLVEIARAVSFHSRVIVMDEPTASLSAAEVESLFATMRRLRGEGVTIIFISHRLDEVLSVAGRIAILRDGRLVGVRPSGGESAESLIRLMVGREVQGSAVAASATSGEVVLRVRDLSRAGSFEGVSFELRRGEILGFAGLVGAQRTEVFRALFGFDPPTGGEVHVAGRRVLCRSPREALALGIGYLPENRKDEGIFPFLGVDKNISMASLAQFSRGGFMLRRAERRAASGYVQSLRVKTAGLDALVHALSGGNQQKVLIARELLARPRILLLDEPTAGIDVGAKFEIYDILAQLAAAGTAIALISSEMNELFRVCHRLIVMCQGRVTGEFDARSVTQEAIMACATRFERREQ